MSPTSMWILSVELRTDLRPVLARVGSQVVAAVAHVSRDVVVDVARALVPQRDRIAIGAHRSVYRFPDLQLLARPSVTAQDVLESAEITHGDQRLPIVARA